MAAFQENWKKDEFFNNEGNILRKKEEEEEDNNNENERNSSLLLGDEDLKELEEEDNENIRIADPQYYDQLIPSAMQDPEYARILNRIQYMDDDEAVMECLASYEESKVIKQREEKYNLTLLQLQHEQALQAIKEQTESEKIRNLLQQEKDNRRKKVQNILMWLARNKSFLSDSSKGTTHSLALQQMERYIEKKKFLSYEIYEFIQEGTKEKFSAILEEITDFPSEEDEEYTYDD